MDERGLVSKLLATGRLNVPERRLLPDGRARFSVMVGVVTDVLVACGWFPRRPQPTETIGTGAVLELREGQVRLHEQHEIGVGRYSPIIVRTFEDVRLGIRAYIAAIGGDPIDGVPVDWRK